MASAYRDPQSTPNRGQEMANCPGGWYLDGSQVGDPKEEQSSLQLRAVGPTDI